MFSQGLGVGLHACPGKGLVPRTRLQWSVSLWDRPWFIHTQLANPWVWGHHSLGCPWN